MKRLRAIFAILGLAAFGLVGCSNANTGQEIDSGKIIIGHVTDSHSWHICD